MSTGNTPSSLTEDFISISLNLDRAGLIWHPEIGDEISKRMDPNNVSILVDPRGLTPRELRECFIWLPTVEQLIMQFEARQALIYHAGVNQSLSYEAVVKTTRGVIETSAATLRVAFGKALRELLSESVTGVLH